ncbi:hypothetical protein EYC80_001122 [Monilinia laxa]|uniref:Major facilitator superfamily (MFS) profile domain-containing protein n=1 Tax=Monilinia laxa TaxID=61186 RepID=A0A5N6K8D6_MONLA|nr:hypothetical protein EYC80_001122 [Monilinia laxa]
MANNQDAGRRVASSHDENDEAPVSWIEVLRCAFPACGGFLFGYDSGYINGCLGMDYFKYAYGEPSNDPLGFMGHMYPTWSKSVIVSLLSVGTFLGALTSGFSSDYFGRRNTILIGCAIYCVGVVLQVAHPSIGLLAAGRTVAGLGIGFVSANIVAFQTEICPKRIRGPCISMYQFGITIGLLIASGVNQGTKRYQEQCFFPDSHWFAIYLCSCPGLGLDDDASRISKVEEMAAANGGWIDCFTGGFHFGSNLFRTFIGTTVQMMQQLTGVNFIFYYGTTYFAQVGLSGVFLLATITNLVNVVSTPVSFWTIERFGRRPLLIYGGAFMAVCEFIIAIVGTVLSTDKTAQVVLFVFVCLHIVGFASTWGPTGWAVSGEMFPLAIRGRGIALSTASNWFLEFHHRFCDPILGG